MEDNEEILKIWASLPKEVQDALRDAAEESSAVTDEQFIAEIMIGECPQCGSKNTKDCEEIDGIEDFTVGLCMNCGFLWCSECGRPLVHSILCNHWAICDTCDETDELGMCDLDPMECKKLQEELGEQTRKSS
jgi:hypothetical protein